MTISTAVDLTAVARVVGIKTTFVDLRQGALVNLPQRIAVIGQGATASTYPTTKAQYTTAFDVGTAYGFGSPLHLAALQLLPANGDGVGTIPVTFYPLEDDASGVAAAGTITPSGAATGSGAFRVRINNIDSAQFAVANGDSVATMTAAITTAVSSVLNMPMTAADGTTVVNLTSKWEGTSGNDLHIEVVPTAQDNTGVTFGVVQPTGGLINPDIAPAIAQIGEVWETIILNCFESTDTTILDALQTENEGRWLPLVNRPFVAFSGSGEADVATAITVPDARKTDRTNVQITLPSSNDLPVTIAARAAARVAPRANNNPPYDYGSLQLTGLTPGIDADQWSYVERDIAVKAGVSPVTVKDGVAELTDVVTYFHPDGDPTPAYRYVVDIVKLQNILFNYGLEFRSTKWDGKPLIPDGTPTTNPEARSPSDVTAASARIVDNLALAAIISDAAFTKSQLQSEIDSQNPKRINHKVTIKLSGNTNIISIDLDFGFFFGVAEAA